MWDIFWIFSIDMNGCLLKDTKEDGGVNHAYVRLEVDPRETTHLKAAQHAPEINFSILDFHPAAEFGVFLFT